MPTSKVAKRYATGLLDFTQDVGNTERVFTEMRDVKATLDQSKELKSLFDSPFINGKKKISISNKVFSGFSETCKNMIALTIRQGRENSLGEICEAYINSVEKLMGVQKVSLTVAASLSEQNIQNILNSSHLFDQGKKTSLSVTVKQEILGGYILRVGDQQIDASVRSKLIGIKKEFDLN